MKIFIQIIGAAGALFAFAAYQNNNHKRIMLCKTASEGAFALQYIFLDAYTGVAMNLLGCIRNLVFAALVKRRKPTAAGIVVFSLLMAGLGALTWAGPISLLAVAGKLFSTLAYGMKNPRLVRLLTIPSSLCWIVYDAICFSLAGIFTESLAIASIFVAEIRFRKSKSGEAEKQPSE